jgi:hypothetical protein
MFVGPEVGDGELVLLPQAETIAAAVIASIPLRVMRSFMCVPPRKRPSDSNAVTPHSRERKSSNQLSLRTSANAMIVRNESMKGGEVRHRERLVAESSQSR